MEKVGFVLLGMFIRVARPVDEFIAKNYTAGKEAWSRYQEELKKEQSKVSPT
jgi:hypothetical protein